MTKPQKAVRDLFDVSHNKGADIQLQASIFPGGDAPVVRVAEDGERELIMMSWGFVLPQRDKAPKRVTNVRDDKILTSSFWKPSFEQRRCLVPATSFCEPKGRAPAVWHWFALTGDDPRPLFAFAGIWRRHRGPIKKDGEPIEIDTYAFMTTKPNELVATVHPSRMPVILATPEDQDTWMRGGDAATALARPHPVDAMEIVKRGSEEADPV